MVFDLTILIAFSADVFKNIFTRSLTSVLVKKGELARNWSKSKFLHSSAVLSLNLRAPAAVNLECRGNKINFSMVTTKEEEADSRRKVLCCGLGGI